jgi:hypothetical protein
MATDQMFLITSVVFVLAASAVWIAPRPRSPAAPVGGAH